VSALFLAPALLAQVWFGWPAGQRHALRTRWAWLAALAVVAAYANVIVFNVLHPGAWEVAAQQKEYAYVAEPSVSAYIVNLSNMLAGLLRMLASSFFGGASLQAQLSQPTPLIFAALAGTGAVLAVRRRMLLPLLGPLGAALGMPWINQNYDFPLGVRYLGFVLPLLSMLVALPLALAVRAAWQRARWLAVVPGLLTLALTIATSVQVARWADDYLRVGATSPQILALQSEAHARYRAGLIGEVLLDPQLDWVYTAPGGRALRVFEVLLEIQDVPHRTVWMVPEHVQAATEGAAGGTLLIVSDASRERLGDRFQLVPLTVPERPHAHRNAYWAYLLPAAPPREYQRTT
jgi:hypothetical protein